MCLLLCRACDAIVRIDRIEELRDNTILLCNHVVLYSNDALWHHNIRGFGRIVLCYSMIRTPAYLRPLRQKSVEDVKKKMPSKILTSVS